MNSYKKIKSYLRQRKKTVFHHNLKKSEQTFEKKKTRCLNKIKKALLELSLRELKKVINVFAQRCI